VLNFNQALELVVNKFDKKCHFYWALFEI